MADPPAAPVLNMKALTARQRDVLSAVAINQDGGHPRGTLEALERKGLIERREVPVTGLPHLTITRWEVPLPVHIQWAAWCSRQVAEEVTDAI
jgi:hypothetical protein